MAREFQRGHKARISDLTAGTDLYVGVRIDAPGLAFDISCFGLDADERLADDRYLVFFNQPKSPEEALQLLGAQAGDTESFRVTLDRIPAEIQRLSFTASVDGEGQMSEIGSGYLRIVAGGLEVARYSFSGPEFTTERALVLGDFYMKDAWRFAAVGQGFDGTLDTLIKYFGGEIAEEQKAAREAETEIPAFALPTEAFPVPAFAPPSEPVEPPAFAVPAPAPAPAPAAPEPAAPERRAVPPAPGPAPAPAPAPAPQSFPPAADDATPPGGEPALSDAPTVAGRPIVHGAATFAGPTAPESTTAPASPYGPLDQPLLPGQSGHFGNPDPGQPQQPGHASGQPASLPPGYGRPGQPSPRPSDQPLPHPPGQTGALPPGYAQQGTSASAALPPGYAHHGPTAPAYGQTGHPEPQPPGQTGSVPPGYAPQGTSAALPPGYGHPVHPAPPPPGHPAPIPPGHPQGRPAPLPPGYAPPGQTASVPAGHPAAPPPSYDEPELLAPTEGDGYGLQTPTPTAPLDWGRPLALPTTPPAPTLPPGYGRPPGAPRPGLSQPPSGTYAGPPPSAYSQAGQPQFPGAAGQGAGVQGVMAALQPYRETATGQRWTLQNEKLVRVDLAIGAQALLARQGTVVLHQGKVDFAQKGAGIAGRVAGDATGQEDQLVRCTGHGQVFLAEDAAHLFPVELQGDAICVSAEHVLAFDEALQYEARRIEGQGIPGGALATLQFQGTGTVLVKTHGLPVVLPVTPTTFADCHAVVAWSAASQVVVAGQVRTRSNAHPGAGGQSVNLQFRGAPGHFIVVQPFEVRGPS
ncbi:TerD family protein [Streptomyces sp. TS71-3]|uniref:TerD family protein n=1 Tax=Streptomyces sp. TS71-3 TaxID=2733862 RepID=UPI001B16DC47|nr:TerD family protein [Streptomyces sp. TS71-3]GHJ35842.1 hypothetical protein Sm713_14510 [Streptomyces sp. TS71-3]